ncbi:MAG TPA: acyltransferase [Actinomycetota bacterium]|nr:acyltransferase [Actinomycetota bacterium]
MASRLDQLARATPGTRDRYVDFLRAASIVAVVFGHWFIGMIHWDHGVVRTTSAVGVTSYLWLGTWVFQVMPIFFFVGGFSNLVAFEAFQQRGNSAWMFIRSREVRLLGPSIVFLAVWTAVQLALHVADIGAPAGPRLWGDTRLLRGMLPPGATVPFGPLWFLGVYGLVVALAPITVGLHRRYGLLVPVGLMAAAVLVDVVGFGLGHPGVRWFNVAFVLLLPHQLGHAYGDGSMLRWPRWVLWGMVAAGLGGLWLLTNPWVFRFAGDVRFEWFPMIGSYPKSLLGTDIEPISNAYPPTVCFLLGGIWSIGAVMLLRSKMSRWLQRSGPWKATIFVNGIIMTLFLWHMTAYLIAVVLLHPFGFGTQLDSTPRWWMERLVWELVPAAILAMLIALFGRFERFGSNAHP